MKKMIYICDLCNEEIGKNGDVNIKYRAKKLNIYFWHREYSWNKIDICQKCLNKIIHAKETNGGEKNGKF